jgi:hypothetical protein
MKVLVSHRALLLLSVLILCGSLSAGCGDDDGSSPEVLTLADFEGYWELTKYKVTDPSNPAVSVELVAAGAEMAWLADNAGSFTGEAFVPAALTGGQAVKFPFMGSFSLVGQDSVRMIFAPEIPPFLESQTVAISLSGNTLSMEDDSSTFDFDQDGTEEPAIFEATVVRGTRVLSFEDFEGYWEAAKYLITDASNPAVSVETVSLGATFSWTVDNAGNFTGDMFLPAALVGQDMDLQFQGHFELVGQDSAYVVFTPEIPPFLTRTDAEYTVWGGVLELIDRTATFDFDQDGTEEAAIFEGTMIWSDPVP